MKSLIAIGAVLAAAALVFLLVRPGASDDTVSAPGTGEGREARLVREDSYLEGPADARATLVEFLDPECESCAAMFPIVERLREEYRGRIRFVVRYFPLHGNSVLAARAIEAAGRQDRYREMYDIVFKNQAAWGERAEPQTAAFVEYARSLGLDIAAFERDLNDPALTAKVERDRADGIALGVEGTPTFFLNGSMAGSMMTYEQLRMRIEAALTQ